MSVTFSAGLVGLDKIVTAAGYVGSALKVWQSFETKRLDFLARGVAAAGCNIEDEISLQRMMENDKNRYHVALLMEKARRAESVWSSYCLGILLGKYLNRGILEIDEIIYSEILSRLTDLDLEFFVRLKPFVEAKTAESQNEITVEEMKDKHHNSIRIEEEDLCKIEFAQENGLEITRIQVNRLTMSFVFSADIGGFGNTGYAHGTFVWGPFTEKFFAFITENNPPTS